MAILGLIGVDIEICGAWVWVTGDTRTHKEVLKENGYKYASKRKHGTFARMNGRVKAEASQQWVILECATAAQHQHSQTMIAYLMPRRLKH